jgi:hypothetical protein
MLGNKHVVQHQGLAAGAEQAQHLPVVDDLDLGERHQEIRDVPGIALLAEKGADDRPLRIVAAARERITPAQPPAARHMPGRLARRQRGRGDGLGVLAPDIDLRLLGILGDDPLMLGEHRIDPGRRRAAIGQLLDDPREQAEPALHAAEAPRLQDAQDAGRVILGDRLGRQLPGCGGGRRALGEKRDQCPRALQHHPLVVGLAAVLGCHA